MWFLSNTILVCLAFWLIFAIMGVQLFAGKFYNVCCKLISFSVDQLYVCYSAWIEMVLELETNRIFLQIYHCVEKAATRTTTLKILL